MTSIGEALLLGIVQGITEWLPISSSGHLVLVKRLFGIAPDVSFDVVLHLGSLFALLIVFWKDIYGLINGILKGERKSLWLLFQLAIASVPIAIVGLLFNDFVKSMFNSKATGVCLLITACILFLSKYPLKKKNKINYFNAIVIGIAQAFALLPGISRSGITISTGLLQGVKREEAVKFAFLLFFPAVVGATILESQNLGSIGLHYIAGALMSLAVGIISIRFLFKIIKRFSNFGWYCLIVGLIAFFL